MNLSVGCKGPCIIAHRGAMSEAPENTHAAFREALRHGVDGLELDIQLTADDIPVIFHDPTLIKVGRDRERISDLSYDDLSTYDFGAWFSEVHRGEPIATLEEVLKRYSSRTRLMIEIKSYEPERERGRTLAAAQQTLRALRRHVPIEAVHKVFILSFDPEVLEFAHHNDPNWKYVLNVKDTKLDDDTYDPDYLFARCISVTRLTPRFVEAVHNRGGWVMTYSCNNARQVKKALEAEVDVIMTDRPAWIVEQPGLVDIRR